MTNDMPADIYDAIDAWLREHERTPDDLCFPRCFLTPDQRASFVALVGGYARRRAEQLRGELGA